MLVLKNRDVGNERPQHRTEIEHLHHGAQRLPALETIEDTCQRGLILGYASLS